MESEFFLNAGIPPAALHFEPTSTSLMPTWPSLYSAMGIQANNEQSPDCFFNPTWPKKSMDHSLQFDSSLSSLVSSPAASNSNISNESFMIRELIGKLGNIGNNNNSSNNDNNSNNSGDISQHSQPMLSAPYGNNSTNNSCYSTPLSSPPKRNYPARDQIPKDSLNFPSLGKPLPLNSSVAGFAADPGFAERAARFSRFGSRSFSGRARQFGPNNAEMSYNCSPAMMGNGNLSRVSSTPSLKAIGSQKGNKNSPLQDRSEEESSVSEQVPNGGGEAGNKASNESNSRKRKAASKGKAKEAANSTKDAENNVADLNTKRRKPNEGNGKENENSPVKAEEEGKGSGDDEKKTKANSKPPEPPKDYIHVRARRGQATDSHSLAERVRREKISERMKLLQDLVPGCSKVTGKALMLDEIINYVQSLQRQVEFLSMKLASVNSRLDFNVDALISKDIFQTNDPLPHPIFPLDSSASAIFGHQPQQNPALPSSISNGTVIQCPVDPLDAGLCQNLNMQLPPLGGFNHGSVSQFPAFCEDDLQSIVQMGFGQNSNREAILENFHGSNQPSNMKIEF